MKGGGFRIYALVYLLFLYAPIILLPLFAFNDATVIAFPLSGFTTELVRRDGGRPAAASGGQEQPDHRRVGVDPVDDTRRLRRPRLDPVSTSPSRAA